MANMFQVGHSVSSQSDDSYIDKLWEEYCEAVEKHAEQVFKKIVLPWLKRNKYSFTASMGVWLVENADGEAIYEQYIKSERVLDALTTEIPGFSHDLGSMMPSYTG